MPKEIDGPELPVLCAKCLGQRERTRMVRDSRGDVCSLCSRPYATFRWKLFGMTKRTTICGSCARSKNICQACTRDLTHGVPIATRDGQVASRHIAPATAKFKAQQHESLLEDAPKPSLRRTIATLPFDGAPLDQRPDNAVWLFVVGLEPGFKMDKLRSELKGSIAHVHNYGSARFALIEFSSPEAASEAEHAPSIVDGTRLSYRWASEPPKLEIDKTLYPKLAIVSKKFVRTGTVPS